MDTFSLAEERIRQLKRSHWADYFFRPLLVMVMVMCLAAALVELVRLINPDWHGFYFQVGILLVTVEAIYSFHILRRYPSWRVSRWRFRLAEAVVLLIGLKLLSLTHTPWPRLKAEVMAMWDDPTVFFNLEFVVILSLTAIAWNLTTQTVADFEALYDPFTDSRWTLNQLTSRFLWGGVLLVLVSGLSQTIILFGPSGLLDLWRPHIGGIIGNVLLYFMLGFVLISQVNLTRLTIRWHLQDITPTAGLAGQWARYGLIFLGLVTLVAFLLPTRYSMGFLEMAGRVVGLLVQLVMWFYYLLFFLIILLAHLLYRLFRGAEPVDTPMEPMGPLRPPPAAAATAPWPWWEFFQSLAFWVAVLAIVLYMARLYLHDHPELGRQLRKFKLIELIWAGLNQLWSALTGWAKRSLALIPRQVKLFELRSAGTPPQERWPWFNLRQADPRRRILAYYLNILRRAEKVGPARRVDQTPYEYEPELEQTVPEAHNEVQQLTEAFVLARYSQASFDQPQAAAVKQQWQRIKRALGHRR